MVLVVLLAVLAIVVDKLRTAEPAKEMPAETPKQTAVIVPTAKPTAPPTVAPTDPPVVETPEIVVTPTPVPDFNPYHTEETNPENFVKQLAVNVDGKTLKEDEPYEPEECIDFLTGDVYTELEGVITFRGNNFRDSPSFGYAERNSYRFCYYWSHNFGSLTAPDC